MCRRLVGASVVGASVVGAGKENDAGVCVWSLSRLSWHYKAASRQAPKAATSAQGSYMPATSRSLDHLQATALIAAIQVVSYAANSPVVLRRQSPTSAIYWAYLIGSFSSCGTCHVLTGG